MGDQFLATVKLIIEENVSNENFTVSHLAEKVGLSRSTLHRKLVRHTGKSATRLITEIRLTKARELIENDVATISEVAYMVGFTSPSYFNRVFKKAYNVSPGEIRKKGSGKLTHQPVLDNVKTNHSPKSRWKIASYISIGIILVLIILNLIQKGNEDKGVEPWRNSIAVLPFHNDSPFQDNEYFIIGLMESITTSLDKIEDLRVSSRSSVEQFRDTVLPIADIAEYLNVNYLLMGSLQKYDDHIWLIIKLIDKNEQLVWTDQYDRVIKHAEDYYKLQSDIAQQVSAELHATLTPEEVKFIERIPTTNIRALGLYRQAREEHMKFWLDHEDMEALKDATAFYRSALKEDPTFGQAYSGLAMAIHNVSWAENWINREFSENENRKNRDTILHLAEKALSFDPHLEDAYLVIGDYFYEIRDYNRALEEYEKALRINPNYSWAYDAKSEVVFYQKGNWIEGLVNKMKAVELEGGDMQVKLLSELGDLYEMMGFPDMAADIYRQTLQLTGDSAKYYFDMGGTAFCKRNWSERIGLFSKSLEIEPDHYYPLIAISNSYRILGNIDSACHYAFLLLEKGKVNDKAGDREAIIAMALLDGGQDEEAYRLIDRLEDYMVSMLESDVQRRDLNLLNLTAVYCLRQQDEKAMEYIRQIDRGSLKPLWFIILLEDFPAFVTIREDQEFQLILNALKLTWQEEHEKVRLWMAKNDMLTTSQFYVPLRGGEIGLSVDLDLLPILCASQK